MGNKSRKSSRERRAEDLAVAILGEDKVRELSGPDVCALCRGVSLRYACVDAVPRDVVEFLGSLHGDVYAQCTYAEQWQHWGRYLGTAAPAELDYLWSSDGDDKE
jgi:hypothetical protein